MCHSATCSLAKVQPCLIALAAAKAAEDAATDTRLLPATAAVATFEVLTWLTEQAVVQVHAAMTVVQVQLWAQQQTNAPQTSLAIDQPCLTAIMLAIVATDTAEAGRSLQQALVAVFVLEINTQQSVETFLRNKGHDCVGLRLHVLEWCSKVMQYSLTRHDPVMLLVASTLAALAEAKTHLQMALAAAVKLWAQQQPTKWAGTTSSQTMAAAMVTKHWQQHRVKALKYSLVAEEPSLNLAVPALVTTATENAAADRWWPNDLAAVLVFAA